MGDLINIIIICASSLVAGFMGGQVGGGGMISIPILLFLGLPVPSAIAIAKAGDIFSNFTAAQHYFNKKQLEIKYVFAFGVVALFGGALGAYVTLTIDENLFKKAIVIVLIILLIVTIFKKEIGIIDKKLHISKRYTLFFLPVLFIVGIYGSVFSIATTTILALLFIFLGQSFSQSMGFALFISAIIAASATVVFLTHGEVIFKYAIPQIIFASTGSYFGSRYAIRKGNIWMKYLFIAVSSVFIVELLVDVYF